MGAEELVWGAGEEVGSEVADVDGCVGCVMHAIDVDERTDLVRLPGNVRDGGFRAEEVGGGSDGDEAGPVGDDLVELREVQFCGSGVERYPADGGTDVLGGLDPGANVGVVVELCDDDLVAGLPRLG